MSLLPKDILISTHWIPIHRAVSFMENSLRLYTIATRRIETREWSVTYLILSKSVVFDKIPYKSTIYEVQVPTVLQKRFFGTLIRNRNHRYRDMAVECAFGVSTFGVSTFGVSIHWSPLYYHYQPVNSETLDPFCFQTKSNVPPKNCINFESPLY